MSEFEKPLVLLAFLDFSNYSHSFHKDFILVIFRVYRVNIYDYLLFGGVYFLCSDYLYSFCTHAKIILQLFASAI